MVLTLGSSTYKMAWLFFKMRMGLWGGVEKKKNYERFPVLIGRKIVDFKACDINQTHGYVRVLFISAG